MFVLFACLFACYMQMSCNLSCHISQPAHHLQMDRCWLTPTNLATWSHFRIILPQQLFAISSYLTPLQNHTIITVRACVSVCWTTLLLLRVIICRLFWEEKLEFITSLAFTSDCIHDGMLKGFNIKCSWPGFGIETQSVQLNRLERIPF